MRTQENKIAKIRKAINEANVSLGELAELQAIAATHPQLFADDPLLAEAAGIPEQQWRQGLKPAAHTPGPWTVGGRSLPSTHAVPVRVNGENLAWVCGLDSALRFSQGETAANARLIAAAPDLLEALKNAREDLSELAQLVQSGSFDAAEDWIEANAAQINVTLSRVIANAEGRDQ